MRTTDSPKTVRFCGGAGGPWIVESVECLAGAPIASVERIAMHDDEAGPRPDALWSLRGVVSHARYTTRTEATELKERQPPLGRPEATCAALIPIRKSPAWWALAQDERRAIYEERSRHTSIGMEYLPRIARRLHHSRDLGEPFDFLTWFEFAPEHAAAFDDLLVRMRASEEWDYVDREVDIRLRLDPR